MEKAAASTASLGFTVPAPVTDYIKETTNQP